MNTTFTQYKKSMPRTADKQIVCLQNARYFARINDRPTFDLYMSKAEKIRPLNDAQREAMQNVWNNHNPEMKFYTSTGEDAFIAIARWIEEA